MEANEVAELVAEESFGELIGVADDGSRFGIYADRMSGLCTNIALRNGYTVEEVREGGRKNDYNFNIQFKRLA